MLLRGQLHAAHTARDTPHGAHIIFVKTYRFATIGKQHYVMLAVSQRHADQIIAFIQVNGDDPGLAWVGEIRQRSFLHRTLGGGEEYILIVREHFYRQNRVDLLATFQRQQINNWPAAGGTGTLGHVVHLDPVHSAPAGEAQNVIVRVGDKQVIYKIVLFRGSRLLATATTLLRHIFR